MAKKNVVEVKQEKATPLSVAGRYQPLVTLRNEIDQLFEDFGWPDFGFPLLRRAGSVEPVRQLRDIWMTAPAMDLVERDGEYEVQAELPGLTIKDVEVKLSEGMLTIRGEKSAERKEDEENYHLHERSYGEFQRCFRLPNGIDPDKVEARFENGVLNVRIPKSAEARKMERKIEVKSA